MNEMEKEQTELLTVEQIASLLNLKISRVRSAIFRKELPGIFRIGRLVRGNKKDLLMWLEKLQEEQKL